MPDIEQWAPDKPRPILAETIYSKIMMINVTDVTLQPVTGFLVSSRLKNRKSTDDIVKQWTPCNQY